MKAIRKLVATTGEYQKDGETKKRYQRLGTMFKDDEGRISIKLDVVPVGPEWSGWVALYEMYDNGGNSQPRQQQAAPSQPAEPTTTRNVHERHGAGAEDGEDIPF